MSGSNSKLRKIIVSEVEELGYEFVSEMLDHLPDDGAYIGVSEETGRYSEISILYGKDERSEEIYLCDDIDSYPDNMLLAWEKFRDVLAEKLENIEGTIYVNIDVLEAFNPDNFDVCDDEYEDD